jgi:hypothetical protein
MSMKISMCVSVLGRIVHRVQGLARRYSSSSKAISSCRGTIEHGIGCVSAIKSAQACKARPRVRLAKHS